MMEKGMTLMSNPVATIKLSVLCLLLVLCLSCESNDKYAGAYEAEGHGGEVLLELKPGGEGAWISGFQEVSFSWYMKGGELRINTREGGVIVGKVQDGTIEITIPGQEKTLFRKAP